MEKIRLIGRNSPLSLLQLEQVRKHIQAAFPLLQVEVLARSSRGDALADIPLQTVEGTDFFTADIFQALETGEADIAVHSLKDMSSAHFFSDRCFGIPDREDAHDVVIFSEAGKEKVLAGKSLMIGTCSPRRETMATVFLQKALPHTEAPREIGTAPIRGNVDTRLRKLKNGEYDAVILAAAGLHRLLNAAETAMEVNRLLQGTTTLFLPLIDCVPAPCQGAIVAEAIPANKRAVEVVHAISNPLLWKACVAEKKQALQYGSGCEQRFGVTSFDHEGELVLYAAGTDQAGQEFQHWAGIPSPDWNGLKLFSSTDCMGSFFQYNSVSLNTDLLDKPVVYVANYKAVVDEALIEVLKTKRVWAAGTRTWLQLAKLGIWVEGCADAFGLEWLRNSWDSPLVKIRKEDVCVLTHEQAAANWSQKGWHALASYAVKKKYQPGLEQAVSEADAFFWTSAEQYRYYSDKIKAGAQHGCPAGETAVQLRQEGLTPVVFPHIKAFQQWRKTYIP